MVRNLPADGPHHAHAHPPSDHTEVMASAAAVVTLNVGGELFQTTTVTLSRASASSPLAASLGPSSPSDPHFLDGDPRLFARLLSFLRVGAWPLPRLRPRPSRAPPPRLRSSVRS
jgi:hypothetical protein